MSASERNRVLLAIRNIALTLSSMPPKYGIQGENYYWSAGYQLNVRVYEKLLLGLFDILEDGQLIEVYNWCFFICVIEFMALFIFLILTYFRKLLKS